MIKNNIENNCLNLNQEEIIEKYYKHLSIKEQLIFDIKNKFNQLKIEDINLKNIESKIENFKDRIDIYNNLNLNDIIENSILDDNQLVKIENIVSKKYEKKGFFYKFKEMTKRDGFKILNIFILFILFNIYLIIFIKSH